ncbi:hypothetical protein FPE01S_03_04750 [Flavihumibacter petaseus NBRC 106054]|uniref:Uncharacterized protein n=2 Tax=Flavihumibacter TaxID=1004301 RepID=A0A0E9N3T3_9BACT|nr:hypothetical protein FPE01S_03_04750 [Flavihumibacter petaseus NBRC 106054]
MGGIFLLAVLPQRLFSQTAKSWTLTTDTSMLFSDTSFVFSCKLPEKKGAGIQPLAAFNRPKGGLLELRGGTIGYQAMYQSNIDTPLIEKNIAQHNVMLQFDMTVAGIIPIQARAWTRQSNSMFYRDITDFQVLYDQSFMTSQLYGSYRQRLLEAVDEKAVGQLSQCLEAELGKLKYQLATLQGGAWQQKLIEAREILNVPGITDDPNLSDSLNRILGDSLRHSASVFINTYNAYAGRIEKWQHSIDSIELIRNRMEAKISTVKRWLDRPDWQDIAGGQTLQDSLMAVAGDWKLPPRLKWLTGIRRFSLGRAPLNSSELTSRNISVNGIAFEYNSWYYLSFAAGGVDYRFRDYGLSGQSRKFQPLVLLRLGIGKIGRDYLIASGYSGRKMISGSSSGKSFQVSGVTLEGKKYIGRTIWISGEVGQSVSPDYRSNPYQDKTSLGFSKDGNSAIAVKAGGILPLIHGRIEAGYKKTGTNFQSFSTWQVNTAQEAWYLKYDQRLLRNQLRFSASLRTNEWQNPNLPQAYATNTIFKTVMLTYARRRWPTVTAGYFPITQLAKVGEQVVETKYQTFSTNIWHQYRLRETPMSTSIALLKSFDGYDSSLFYQNSSNLQVTQTLFFRLFTSSLAVSKVSNTMFQMWVGDHKLQVPLLKGRTVVGIGVKVYNYNYKQSAAGCSFSAAFAFWHQAQLAIFAERAFLPTASNGLQQADIGNIQFTKSFQFKSSRSKQTN